MSKVVKYYYTRQPYKIVTLINPLTRTYHDVEYKYVGNRYTMAAVYDDESHTIKLGLSACRPQDNFDKSIGRKIAEKNAEEKPFAIINDFNGRRNDYADQVMMLFQNKEEHLLYKHYNKLTHDGYTF